MFIKFNKIKLKNLLSYGNNLTELNFEKGLILVTAQNGDGKSALFLDALSYGLFGKPYRKIKNKELINRTNKKNLWVQVDFNIDNKNYILTRGMSPDILEITVDGQEFSLLSSKNLNQDEIDKILGCDYNLFKHVICLSINYNKAFFSLSLQEKRDLIESIFNIKIFGEMLSKIKKESSAVKMEKEIRSSEEKNIEHVLLSLNNQIKTAKKSSESFDLEKQSEINSLTSELKSNQSKLDKLDEEIQNLESQVSKKHSIGPLEKEIDSIKSNGMNINAKIDQLNEKISFLDENDVCPVCSSDLDEKHRNKEKTALIIQIETLNSELDGIRDLYKTKNAELKTKKNENDLQDKILRELEIKKSNKRNLQDIIKRIKTNLDSTVNRKLDLNISSLQDEFESNKEKYSIVTEKVNDLSMQSKILESCATVLDDKGIKAFFYKKLIPILNLKINTYLDKFDLPVKITFNETMQEYIDSLAGHGRNISYFSFSEGEKKRIDIAMMLSFIETTKTISNWNSNVLIFDEIFDSATDSTGLDKIMDSIKSVTEERNLCCYVISHREADHHNYTGKINIKKVDGFSGLA